MKHTSLLSLLLVYTKIMVILCFDSSSIPTDCVLIRKDGARSIILDAHFYFWDGPILFSLCVFCISTFPDSAKPIYMYIYINYISKKHHSVRFHLVTA